MQVGAGGRAETKLSNLEIRQAEMHYQTAQGTLIITEEKVTFAQPAGSPGIILPISSLRALINGSR